MTAHETEICYYKSLEHSDVVLVPL